MSAQFQRQPSSYLVLAARFLEDKASASLVVRGVGSEEVDPHSLQFLGAIACKWLGAFVVLPPKIPAVSRLFSEAPCSFSQFLDESRGILSKRVVEKSNLQRRLRPNRLSEWINSSARVSPTRRGSV